MFDRKTKKQKDFQSLLCTRLLHEAATWNSRRLDYFN